MPKGLFVLSASSYDLIYGPEERAQVEQLIELIAPPQTAGDVNANPAILREAEVIFSGWGAPRFTSELLEAAPHLKLVLYGAGSVRNLVTEAFWDRGIRLCSAAAANAQPVAEFTFAQIILCLKQAWSLARIIREQGRYPSRETIAGAYGSTVGVVSLGLIGRLVCDRLKTLDVNVIAFDPVAPDRVFRDAGAEPVALDELFRRSDVLTLHTPWLPETEGMVRGEHFEAMKPKAAFINTARGAVVNEPEMIEVLKRRPDLTAVLDVTYPEPPKPGSPLYTMPNVVLTPHIAGSIGPECRRMGQLMIDELKRYLAGEPLQHEVTRDRAAVMA